MKIYQYLSAVRNRLLLFCNIVILACVPAYVYSIEGGYVVDNVITVPAYSYTTFSTVHEGKRYYMGVDTVAAKSGTYSIMAYNAPSYATMWIAGPLWSYTGSVLPNKDYTRWVKNVWLEERLGEDSCYLARGENKGGYAQMILTDSLNSTMWHTAKDMTVQSQYMHGFTYEKAEIAGVETYRYMTYDPVYGFTRLYEVRPSVSQRISVWDRTTGPDITCTLTPSAYSFDLTTKDTTKLSITSRVYYYSYVDRFRSRFDQMDIYAARSEANYDQQDLVNNHGLFGFYEWTSNPREPEHPLDPRNPEYLNDKTKWTKEYWTYVYDGRGVMPYYGVTGVEEDGVTPIYGKVEATVLWVSDTKYDPHWDENLWYDTIFAIGISMYDVHEAIDNGDGTYSEGALKDHSDWLRQHFYIDGNHFVDSILINRRTFLDKPFTTMTSNVSPADAVFDYSYDNKKVDGETAIVEADTARTFSVTAHYTAGSNVMYINNTLARRIVRENDTLHIENLKAIEADEVLYDTLLVEALMPNGSSAIYNAESNPTGWVESVRLIGKDQIRVKVRQFDGTNYTQTPNRTAQIRYTYRYLHSASEGDIATSTRSIWLTQKSRTAQDASLYTFTHKSGKGGEREESIDTPQGVHTKEVTLYAIPSTPLQLPVHRDYWGYYRWYKWDGTDVDNEVDVENASPWTWFVRPKNVLDEDFMVINPITDVSSRGQWDIINHDGAFAQDHFDTDEPTATPEINYPASSSAEINIACDVSGYTDINTSGVINESLTAFTEPTLSYRNIFHVKPAYTQADKMRECRVGDEGHNGWMETHNILAPAGRAFTLQQQYPVLDANHNTIKESELQYIYYFNPDATGNKDDDMGTRKDDVDLTSANCYARIGKPSYTEHLHATLLTAEDLRNMEVGDAGAKTILVVNPLTYGYGYVLGHGSGDEITTRSFYSEATDAASVNNFLDRNMVDQPGYVMTLTKVRNSDDNIGDFTIALADENENRKLTAYYRGTTPIGHTVRWPNPIRSGNFDEEITISKPYTENQESDYFLITDHNALFRMYFSYDRYLFVIDGDNGYAAAYNKFGDRRFSIDDSELNLFDKSSNFPGPDGYKEANGSWCFYEIGERTPHEEHPYWEYSENGTDGWTRVADKETASTGYTMLTDGSLRIAEGVHTTAGVYFHYRLRTEHFQLAKFDGWVTNDTTDGPSASTILSEDSIQNHYDILYTLGNDLFPAPNTHEPRAYYHHMPWSFTELAYHYPVGEGDHEIPTTHRVYDDFLPAPGEYAYINKFVEPGNPSNVVEPLGGAEHGYMMCINVPQKPVTIFDFEYPRIPCSDQKIFLTAVLCNPVNNDYNPQITADLEGWTGSAWVPIYRYKTGEIPYNEARPWYQLVLPINQDLTGYQNFRCVATMPGSMSEKSYVLIDRMRFIAKERPVNIFQNKASCLGRDGSGVVDIIARLDYKNATFPAGTHFAYQYQKKVEGAFEALRTAAEGEKDHPVKYANDLGSFQMQDINDKSCGVITMPAKDYTPTEPGDTIVLPGGITAHLKTYVNEGSDEHPYYVMYISEPVYAQARDTFRVAMTTISGASDKPDFSDADCAMQRLIPIHNPVELHVNGDATEWPENSTREDTVVAANETYTVTAQIGDAFLPSGHLTKSGKCMFDVVRTMADDRGYEADEWFKKRFGCSRAQFRDIMTIFRADDDRNPMRLETNWNNVRPEMFQYSGRTKQQADSMYTILNRLIVDSAFVEIGKSSYDIYLGKNNNAYVVFWPIPASGQYVDATTYDIKQVSVCSTPRWFEIHSATTSTASLRFGYDNMFEGDYYILPVVRASSKDANTSLKVRLAEITHEESGTVAVMKWNATELIETNDTAWHSAVFKYCQDKDVRGAEPPVAVADYYHTGNEVTFTPAAGNAYTLKAGYWYKFRVQYYAATTGGTFTEGAPVVGNAEFVLAVAPDTVHWTPSHPAQTNYWNDDNNWTPVMAKKPADGFKARVPMNGTKVIIPQTEEGLLPVLSDAAINNQDLRDYGYAKNTCEKILFKPLSMMLGQEKLNYDTAFVDVHFTTGEWQTFTPALDDIYSGDMYIPFSTSYNHEDKSNAGSIDTVDFAPKPFPYSGDFSGDYNPREYPFAFYQGFYNAAVPVPFYNTDTENNELTNDSAKSKSAVDWVRTPSLNMHYAPGSPCVIQGFDATDLDGNGIVVRLPKKETIYYGYGKYGENYISGASVDLGRTPADHNLAYDHYDHASIGTNGIEYTLRNATPADLFFFGNPTMALVDVYKLCSDEANKSKLKHEGDTYHFTAYQLVEGSSYTVNTITGPGQYFIAPQRAVGLVADKPAKELTITLKPSALVALTGEGIVVNSESIAPTPSSAPKRTKTIYEEPQRKWLYVTASNETDWGVKKSYLTLGEQTGANRGYSFGEDALNIASGLNYYDDASFSTPLSLYTIADNKALMQDVRGTLSSVPLVFSTLPEYSYSEYTFLSFSTDGAWDKPLYLYDALTNDSVMIRNGLKVAVQTPENDQIRYFINGRRIAQATEHNNTTTDLSDGVVINENAAPNGVSATVIYDLLGRRVMTLGEYDLISNIQLPTGVYIIQRGANTERMVIR